MKARPLPLLGLLLAIVAGAWWTMHDETMGGGPAPAAPEAARDGTGTHDAAAVAPDAPAAVPATEEPAPEGTVGLLRGRVLDEEGRLLPGSAVFIDGWKNDRSETGEYRIEGLPPGRYLVTAAARGHPPVAADADVREGEETVLDFTLPAGGGFLAGRVVDEAGRPVAGASVAAYAGHEDFSVFRCLPRVPCNENGRFRIEGLPPGSCSVSASAPLFRPGKPVQAEAGRSDLEIVLRPGAAIVVRPVLPEGAPADAVVCSRIQRADVSPDEDYTCWSRLDPDREPETLKPSRYRVRVRVLGVGWGEVAVDVGPGERRVVEVPVRPGETLTGRVLSSEGRIPIAGARVVLCTVGLCESPLDLLGPDVEVERYGAALARTDAEGRFSFDALAREDWSVAVAADGHAPVVGNGIRPGGPPIELVLARGGSLVVTARGPGGQPVAGADVMVGFGTWGLDFMNVQTNETGTVTLPALPPGPLELDVQSGMDWIACRERVDIRAGETVRVDVRFPSGASLVARVTKGGEPERGRPCQVTCETEDGLEIRRWVRTDGDGVLRVDELRPGPVTVTLGRRFYDEGPPRELLLGPGENRVEIAVDAASLLLRIVDAETGEPLKGWARIGRLHASADEDGLLRLDELPAEEVQGCTMAKGYADTPFRAVASPNPSPVTVRLPRAADLVLLVRTPAGEKVAGATVRVLDAAGADVTFETLGMLDPEAIREGRFAFRVVPGTYRVRAERAGLAGPEIEVTVPPEGARATVEIPGR